MSVPGPTEAGSPVPCTQNSKTTTASDAGEDPTTGDDTKPNVTEEPAEGPSKASLSADGGSREDREQRRTQESDRHVILSLDTAFRTYVNRFLYLGSPSTDVARTSGGVA